MAGDWIKVEHATVDKPEVIRLADLMGFHPDQAIGLLVRFWVWLDRNLRDDSVTLLYAKTIDAVTHENGFAGALCAIGWASMDQKTGIVTLKNVERHNGNPAKTRALARNRNVTLRLRDRDAPTVSREEKRREDINTSTPAPKSRRKPQTQVPEDFAISEGVQKWAAANGFGRLPAHLEHFKLTCAAKGYAYSDHDAALKKAIRADWAKLGKEPVNRLTVLPDLPRRDGDIPDAAKAVIARLRVNHG
jgi:hypothetical protein